MPTFEAETQMHPRVADLDAILTYMFVGLLDFDLIKMRAILSHAFYDDGLLSSDARSHAAKFAPAS